MLSDVGHHAIKDMVHGVEIEKPSLGFWAKIKRWWGSKTW